MNGSPSRTQNITTRWREWLQLHGPRLLLFARQQTRSLEDAEDLVQSAVVRCWQSGADGACPSMGKMVLAIRWAAIDQGRRVARRENREAAYQQELEVRGGADF